MLKRNFDTTGIITDNTYSFHLYGRRMRARLVEKEGGKPHPKSVLGKLLVKHGIDPDASPIPVKKKPNQDAAPSAPAKVAAPSVAVPSDRVNLTQLADKYGSDKGSTKHRYTELYHMLFEPLRERKMNFLEMGLFIGGPEHGVDKDRVTTDLPSIKMWLEYFPKSHIHGLDISVFHGTKMTALPLCGVIWTHVKTLKWRQATCLKWTSFWMMHRTHRIISKTHF